jgi:transcriptional regulator with XRE-family HTH domain
MKVGEQIRARREKQGLTIAQFAKRLDVSEQAVRYWESGRSAPRRQALRSLEAALNFTIDWTEGKSGRPMGAAGLIDQADVELLLLICRLPPEMKHLLAELAGELVKTPVRKSRAPFADAERNKPMGDFAAARKKNDGRRKGMR